MIKHCAMVGIKNSQRTRLRDGQPSAITGWGWWWIKRKRKEEREDRNLIKIVKWWVNLLLEPAGKCWGGGMVETAGSNAEMSWWEIHQLKYTEKKLVRCGWDMAWGDWGTLHVWRCATRADCLNWLTGFTSFVTSEMLVVCVLQRYFCQQWHAVSLQDCWKPTVCRHL